ncbi:TRAP transporter substrate-binding protein [Rhodoferax sp.]|uniref:TRAP transporter substrate-binding protein n=1 Tax=Rhodoferax sp. TaxID=50421 RepID=UPI0025D79BD8|nr:TRAP transporter substrate-binding protein [Rhodoferax sp.]
MIPRTPWRYLVLACLLLVGTTGQAQTKLRAWNIHPDGYPVTEALKRFASLVAQGTQGRYQVEIFSNATLGDQPKAVQMLKSGEIDLAEFSVGPLSDAAPGIRALNLPFLFTDSAHMFKHLDGKLGERFAAKLQAAGFVVLGWYDGGARSFYCVNRPINSFKDLAGTRIRVRTEVFSEMVKLLGATPVDLPFKDVMAALEKGEVDCAENNMPSFESTGHYKVAKSVYMTQHVISPEALVVSTKLWASLNAADKTAFQKAGSESALVMRELWNKRVASAVETASKQGVQFVRVKDVAPMVRRMAPLYGKYMADPNTREELLSIIGN